MKKQLQNKTVYKPNKFVAITVVNTPHVDETTGETYVWADVTIKVKNASVGSTDLKFSTDDEISDFLNNIDVTEEQTSMDFGGKE